MEKIEKKEFNVLSDKRNIDDKIIKDLNDITTDNLKDYMTYTKPQDLANDLKDDMDKKVKVLTNQLIDNFVTKRNKRNSKGELDRIISAKDFMNIRNDVEVLVKNNSANKKGRISYEVAGDFINNMNDIMVDKKRDHELIKLRYCNEFGMTPESFEEMMSYMISEKQRYLDECPHLLSELDTDEYRVSMFKTFVQYHPDFVKGETIVYKSEFLDTYYKIEEDSMKAESKASHKIELIDPDSKEKSLRYVDSKDVVKALDEGRKKLSERNEPELPIVHNKIEERVTAKLKDRKELIMENIQKSLDSKKEKLQELTVEKPVERDLFDLVEEEVPKIEKPLKIDYTAPSLARETGNDENAVKTANNDIVEASEDVLTLVKSTKKIIKLNKGCIGRRLEFSIPVISVTLLSITSAGYNESFNHPIPINDSKVLNYHIPSINYDGGTNLLVSRKSSHFITNKPYMLFGASKTDYRIEDIDEIVLEVEYEDTLELSYKLYTTPASYSLKVNRFIYTTSKIKEIELEYIDLKEGDSLDVFKKIPVPCNSNSIKLNNVSAKLPPVHIITTTEYSGNLTKLIMVSSISRHIRNVMIKFHYDDNEPIYNDIVCAVADKDNCEDLQVDNIETVETITKSIPEALEKINETLEPEPEPIKEKYDYQWFRITPDKFGKPFVIDFPIKFIEPYQLVLKDGHINNFTHNYVSEHGEKTFNFFHMKTGKPMNIKFKRVNNDNSTEITVDFECSSLSNDDIEYISVNFYALKNYVDLKIDPKYKEELTVELPITETISEILESPKERTEEEIRTENREFVEEDKTNVIETKVLLPEEVLKEFRDTEIENEVIVSYSREPDISILKMNGVNDPKTRLNLYKNSAVTNGFRLFLPYSGYEIIVKKILDKSAINYLIRVLHESSIDITPMLRQETMKILFNSIEFPDMPNVTFQDFIKNLSERDIPIIMVTLAMTNVKLNDDGRALLPVHTLRCVSPTCKEMNVPVENMEIDLYDLFSKMYPKELYIKDYKNTLTGETIQDFYRKSNDGKMKTYTLVDEDNICRYRVLVSKPSVYKDLCVETQRDEANYNIVKEEILDKPEFYIEKYNAPDIKETIENLDFQGLTDKMDDLVERLDIISKEIDKLGDEDLIALQKGMEEEYNTLFSVVELTKENAWSLRKWFMLLKYIDAIKIETVDGTLISFVNSHDSVFELLRIATLLPNKLLEDLSKELETSDEELIRINESKVFYTSDMVRRYTSKDYISKFSDKETQTFVNFLKKQYPTITQEEIDIELKRRKEQYDFVKNGRCKCGSYQFEIDYLSIVFFSIYKVQEVMKK